MTCYENKSIRNLYLKILISSIILINTTKAQAEKDIDGDIDYNGPEPMLPHTSYYEPATVPLGVVDGCICKESPNIMSVFYGKTCRKFPSTIPIKTDVLKFKNTLVERIDRNDFQKLWNLTYIEIESNRFLNYFEPGCFSNMTRLTNLSISFNDNLKEFEENTFEGLINLKEIFLRGNGIVNILDVTRALSTRFVPNLRSLIMNRNILRCINKDDFKPMEGSLVEVLNMILCQIDYIHPEALEPLKNLKALRLGENLFTSKSMTDLINRTISFGINLQILNLYETGLRGVPPKGLMEVISRSGIRYLNLGRNHFEHLTEHSFPEMPNLETLVLRDVVTVDITNDTFRKMPKLKHLVLNSNRLTLIPEGVIIKTLNLLDISSNSYTSDIPFGIPNEIFRDLSNLKRLMLSFNQIEVLTPSTFVGLNNLEILELNYANLNTIILGTFLPLNNLKRLNLENNYIGTDIILTADLFQGLDNLEVLLLGGCHINNLTSHPSVFKYLPKLKYVGLQRNGLHTISSNQFKHSKFLTNIDLSENNLIPWYSQIFEDIQLKNLNLGQNKLTTITPRMLQDFIYLESWMLDGNPFICDCTWGIILDWLKNCSFTTQKNFTSICVSPDQWRNIPLTDYLNYLKTNIYDCQNKQVTNKVLLTTFLTIFVIFTTFLLFICYYYRWNIRYWIFLARKEIQRKRKHIKIRPEIKTNKDYKYDAFVSYSNEDKIFVCKLIDELENYFPYFKLCVYERDFEIGTVISESVIKNIEMSKRIILIVSESFARSQWCRFEMYLAECHQLQIDYDDGLILVKIGRVSNKYMTPFLKYLMKSRIYLDWECEINKQKLFWDKLRSTLSSPK